VRAQAWLALKLRRELYGSRSERKARLLERSIHEDFAVNYARAREARADARSDKIDRPIDQMLKGEIKSDVARVAIDALRWQAGREQPKRYGDKILTEHTGRDGGPIQRAETRDVVKDHLEGLAKRFGEGLKVVGVAVGPS
jgi:hypothetical protein